jgi:hypothetical protein
MAETAPKRFVTKRHATSTKRWSKFVHSIILGVSMSRVGSDYTIFFYPIRLYLGQIFFIYIQPDRVTGRPDSTHVK